MNFMVTLSLREKNKHSYPYVNFSSKFFPQSFSRYIFRTIFYLYQLSPIIVLGVIGHKDTSARYNVFSTFDKYLLLYDLIRVIQLSLTLR